MKTIIINKLKIIEVYYKSDPKIIEIKKEILKLKKEKKIYF